MQEWEETQEKPETMRARWQRAQESVDGQQHTQPAGGLRRRVPEVVLGAGLGCWARSGGGLPVSDRSPVLQNATRHDYRAGPRWRTSLCLLVHDPH